MSDLAKLTLKKNRLIYLKENCEISELAEKLETPINADYVRKLIDIGIKSPYSEKQLLQKIEELEYRKRVLEAEIKQIAVQYMPLESRYQGLRMHIAKIFNDNRVQVFHLSAYQSFNKNGKDRATELIQKYINYSKSMHP